jgi:hypothetical protein
VLSAIKSWFSGNKSEALDLSLLDNLHVGYSVGFGFMPQSLLSGKRFQVSEVNSYRFDDQRFLSYQISNHAVSTPMQMIVQQDDEDSYLAISMLLDSEDQKELFGRALESRDSIFLQDKLVLNGTDSQRLDGWFVGQYKKVLDGVRGEFMRGHYQLSGRNNEVWDFQYYLFADETNEHAIEIERYDHGEFKIYVTVFRPVTDIGQVRKPDTVVRPLEQDRTALSIITPLSPIEQVRAEPALDNETLVEKVLHVAPASVKPVVIHPTRTHASQKQKKIAKEVIIKPVAKPRDNKRELAISCSTGLLSKLLEESDRSEISLTQLVRKVIGLPVQYNETVLVPLQLTDEEMDAIAAKLGSDAKDSKSMSQAIIRELELFTGIEEKEEVA